VGFVRFGGALVDNAQQHAPPKAQLAAIGHVNSPWQNPGLFLLAFRSERLRLQPPAVTN
jgi:hypothetical protein